MHNYNKGQLRFYEYKDWSVKFFYIDFVIRCSGGSCDYFRIFPVNDLDKLTRFETNQIIVINELSCKIYHNGERK